MKELLKGIELLAEKRYSCRTFKPVTLNEKDIDTIKSLLSEEISGPFGNKADFFFHPTDKDKGFSLNRYGTSFLLKNPPAYICSRIADKEHNLEDFGYLLERLVFKLTALDFGTCWLGGFFKREVFFQKLGIPATDIIPAILAIGYKNEKPALREKIIRSRAGSDNRLAFEEIFFDSDFAHPLRSITGSYRKALDVLRLSPSASNNQPWRIVKKENHFHFFLKRTPNYLKKAALFGAVDLQRIDMGIAMSHFELLLRELKAKGKWEKCPNHFDLPDLTEYLVTWVSEKILP